MVSSKNKVVIKCIGNIVSPFPRVFWQKDCWIPEKDEGESQETLVEALTKVAGCKSCVK